MAFSGLALFIRYKGQETRLLLLIFLQPSVWVQAAKDGQA